MTPNEREEFVSAYMHCVGEAVMTIEEGRPWSPTLLLDLGNEVARAQLDSETVVRAHPDPTITLAGAVRATRNTMPRSRPLETVMVVVLLRGPVGSTIMPSEDPRRRSFLVAYKQVPSGAYACFGRECHVDDDGSVSWTEEPVDPDDLPFDEIGAELADWMGNSPGGVR
jgi:hypothetical protein